MKPFYRAWKSDTYPHVGVISVMAETAEEAEPLIEREIDIEAAMGDVPVDREWAMPVSDKRPWPAWRDAPNGDSAA